jgi:hypothetical protein
MIKKIILLIFIMSAFAYTQEDGANGHDNMDKKTTEAKKTKSNATQEEEDSCD